MRGIGRLRADVKGQSIDLDAQFRGEIEQAIDRSRVAAEFARQIDHARRGCGNDTRISTARRGAVLGEFAQLVRIVDDEARHAVSSGPCGCRCRA